ncbi:hypothetical protein DFH28DRAFT_1172624 [Melampsora americana]|nr:hypothetical protein DFH28DRAFT_1172624 [Melampsora americana]
MTGLLHVCLAYVKHACNQACFGRNFLRLRVMLVLRVAKDSGSIVKGYTNHQPSHEVTPHSMSWLLHVCMAYVKHACNQACFGRNFLRLRVMLVLRVAKDSGSIVKGYTNHQPSHEVTPHSMTGLLHVCLAYVKHACNQACFGRNFLRLRVMLVLRVAKDSGSIVKGYTNHQPSHEVTPHSMTGLLHVCLAYVKHACNQACFGRNFLRLRVMLVLRVANDSGTIVKGYTNHQPSHEVTPHSMTGLLHVCLAYVKHACNQACFGRNFLRLRVMLVLRVANDSGTMVKGYTNHQPSHEVTPHSMTGLLHVCLAQGLAVT